MTAFLTDPVYNNSFAENSELALDFLRNLQFITHFTVKVYDFSALYTVEMMMTIGIWVESSRSPGGFDNINESDLSQRQQGSVDCVIRNIGKITFQSLKHHVCRGVILRIEKLFVNGNPLWCYLQVVFFARLFYPRLNRVIVPFRNPKELTK